MDDIYFKLISAILTVVGIFLAWYKLYVTRPIDKAKQELASLDYQIKKHQNDLNKEYPYVEFKFKVESHKNNNSDSYSILVDTICTNKGRRIAECIVHSEILTVAKISFKKGEPTIGNHIYGKFYKLENGENKQWRIYTIFPEATTVFPFFLEVQSKGFYYLQVKLKMSKANDQLFRSRISDLTNDPVYWSGSTYIQVG